MEGQDSYHIKSGIFEGPIGVLLELIEKRKLFINELSLGAVTEDFINYVREKGDRGFQISSEFIFIISTLILIKSRSLLPGLKLTNEEEKDIKDLEKRIALYNIFIKTSKKIKPGRNLFAQKKAPDREARFIPDERLTLSLILESVKSVLIRVPKVEKLPEVTVRKIISIEEMFASIVERIEEAVSHSFSDLARHPNPEDERDARVYSIVSFLAVLELMRQGILDITQNDTFSDMTITKVRVLEIEENNNN